MERWCSSKQTAKTLTGEKSRKIDEKKGQTRQESSEMCLERESVKKKAKKKMGRFGSRATD